jgi:hypothetical protein
MKYYITISSIDEAISDNAFMAIGDHVVASQRAVA